MCDGVDEFLLLRLDFISHLRLKNGFSNFDSSFGAAHSVVVQARHTGSF
jgi:hypothetical protein